VANNRERWRSQLIAWWYSCVAFGFLLLAIANLLWRGSWWLIALRLVIAAGFAFLAREEFRKRPR
jgi:fatty acid desaturase